MWYSRFPAQLVRCAAACGTEAPACGIAAPDAACWAGSAEPGSAEAKRDSMVPVRSAPEDLRNSLLFIYVSDRVDCGGSVRPF